MLERMDMLKGGRGFYGGFGAYSGLVGIGWCIFCVVCFDFTDKKHVESVFITVFMMNTFFFKEEGKYFGCCWLCVHSGLSGNEEFRRIVR